MIIELTLFDVANVPTSVIVAFANAINERTQGNVEMVYSEQHGLFGIAHSPVWDDDVIDEIARLYDHDAYITAADTIRPRENQAFAYN